MDSLQTLFHQLRQQATINCLNALSATDEVKLVFGAELELLWDAVENYLATQKEGSLEAVLDRWTATQPENHEQNSEVILMDTVNSVFGELWKTIFSNQPAQDANRLFIALYPLIGQANFHILKHEVTRSTNALSSVLTETQNNLEFIEKNKSKFIRIAAHELKTPLTIINGYASMLSEMLTEEHESLKEMVKGIEAGARRLSNLVQDLIDISLIDNRLLNLSIQPVWLDRLFETLNWEFFETFEKRQLTFSVHAFDGLGQMILSDPDRLMQIFRNLLSNAIKYTPDGGQIIIDGRTLPGFVEVIITDTGVGIAPENQAHIFEKFIQFGESATHSSSKTRYMGGGPGLGLHITKGILETMGGAIWVESPGFDENNCPGSSFHVLIPIDQQTPRKNIEDFLRQ